MKGFLSRVEGGTEGVVEGIFLLSSASLGVGGGEVVSALQTCHDSLIWSLEGFSRLLVQ